MRAFKMGARRGTGLMLAVCLGVVGVVVGAGPAMAVDTRTVISVQVPSNMGITYHRLDAVVAYYNNYTTKTRMAFQSCTTGQEHLCIKVSRGQWPDQSDPWWPMVVAFAREPGPQGSGVFGEIVYVAENFNTFTSNEKWNLTAHEMGHVKGMDHTNSCLTVMHTSAVICQEGGEPASAVGTPIPRNLLGSEKAYLATK